MVDGVDVLRRDAARPRARARVLAGGARRATGRAATGARFTHVLALGIGGSALGPRLVIEALRREADGPRGALRRQHRRRRIRRCARRPRSRPRPSWSSPRRPSPRRRRWPTPSAAREWIVAALGARRGRAAHGRRHRELPRPRRAWGLPECNVFPVRRLGRRALLALVLGGTADRDRHRHAALRAPARRRPRGGPGVPLRPRSSTTFPRCWASSASGIATRSASPSHAVLPYASRLESLPAYLQQLEMESNGKRVGRRRRVLDYATCPVDLGRRRHARPARVPPVAAPGHRPRRAAISSWWRSPMGTERAHHEILLAHACAQSRGADDRRATRRAAPRLPRRPREHDVRAAAPGCLPPGRPARDLRAQGLRAGDASGASTPSTSAAWSWARTSPGEILPAVRGAAPPTASGHAPPARRDPQDGRSRLADAPPPWPSTTSSASSSRCRIAVAIADAKGEVAFANAAFAELSRGETAPRLAGHVARRRSSPRTIASASQQNIARVAEGKAASSLVDAQLATGQAPRWVQRRAAAGARRARQGRRAWSRCCATSGRSARPRRR